MSSHETPNKSNADPETEAAVGSIVAIPTTLATFFGSYPMLTMITRLQAPAGMIATGGYRGLFQGFSPFLATLVTVPTVYATFQNYVKPHYPKVLKDNVMFNNSFDAGEHTTSHVCTMPFIVMMVKMQIGESKGFDNTFNKIWNERKGFPLSRFTRGLFRGGSVFFIHDAVMSDCVMEPLCGGILNMIQKSQSHPLSPHQICLGGALSGCVIGAALNPLLVVAIRCAIGTDAYGIPYKGVVDTFRRSCSWSVLRRGMAPSMMYNGIIYSMVYDFEAFGQVFAPWF